MLHVKADIWIFIGVFVSPCAEKMLLNKKEGNMKKTASKINIVSFKMNRITAV